MLPTERIAHSVRQETVALRDFDPAYVADGVMNGPKATSALSPFDSQLRTLVGAARRSHSCHERKSLPLCAAPLLPDMSRRDCPCAALNTPPLALAGRPAVHISTNIP